MLMLFRPGNIPKKRNNVYFIHMLFVQNSKFTKVFARVIKT
jgi:hypothetical protein